MRTLSRVWVDASKRMLFVRIREGLGPHWRWRIGVWGGMLWVSRVAWWACQWHPNPNFGWMEFTSTWLIAGLGLVWGAVGWSLCAGRWGRYRAMMSRGYARLGASHTQLQRMIDGSNLGVLAVDLEGSLRPVWSLSVARWFGPPSGEKIWDYLFSHDEDLRTELQRCLEGATEQMKPMEVLMAHMPRTFVREGRTYQVSAKKASYVDDDHVVMVLRDISRSLVLKKADHARREFQTIITNLVKDPASAQSFLQTMHERFAELARARVDAVRFVELLHAINGQAALFGFADFSEQCYAHEVTLKAGATSAKRAVIAQELWNSWRYTLASIESIVEDRTSDIIEADTRAYQVALERLEDIRARNQLVDMVRESRLESTSQRLSEIRDQTERLAKWTGKSVDVEVKDNGVRVTMDGFQAFWSNLIHVIRNALDHGIEASEERRELGKHSRGRLLLETQWDRDTLYVTVEDDGRGIDWEAIRDKAVQRGLPVSSQQELIKALCTEGVTSSPQLGMLSGRGQGMSEVKQSCEALGGRFRVLSTAGEGTRFEFFFPQVV